MRHTLAVPFSHEPGTHFEYAQYPRTLLSPYEGVDSAPVDIGYWVDPASVLGWMGVGPRGPDGCNALGCDEDVAYEGTLEIGHDAAATAGWKLTGG